MSEAGIVDWYVSSPVDSWISLRISVPQEYLQTVLDDILLVFCVMLMVDVFLSFGDILFLPLLAETWSTTVTTTMDPWPHRLHSKLHYHFSPNHRPKRLHHKLHTLNMDT